jgi:hypothetical protein
MTTPEARRIWLAALILRIALSGWSIAGGTAHGAELSWTLETAGLSSEAKALVGEKARDAIRAGVSEDDVAELVRRGVDRGVPAGELVRLLEVVAEAKRRDLPVGPVLDKVKEGLAKHVPADRIVSAASRVSRDLTTARDLIQQAERDGVRVEKARARKEAMEEVADALARGVPPQELEKLGRHVAGSPHRAEGMSLLEEGVEATADLASMGLAPPDASAMVAAALGQGLNEDGIERLPKALARQLKQGASLEEGARRLREEIRSGRLEHRDGREVEIYQATVPSAAEVLAKFAPGVREVEYEGLDTEQANAAFLSPRSNVLLDIGNRLSEGLKVKLRAGSERFTVKSEDGQVRVSIEGVRLDAKARGDLLAAFSKVGRFELRGVDPTTGNRFRLETRAGVVRNDEVEPGPGPRSTRPGR